MINELIISAEAVILLALVATSIYLTKKQKGFPDLQTSAVMLLAWISIWNCFFRLNTTYDIPGWSELDFGGCIMSYIVCLTQTATWLYHLVQAVKKKIE